MSIGIVFSQTARRKLRDRLARELADDPLRLGTAMEEIESKLSRIFPDGHAIIVQDLYGGFRERPEEVVLLVELSKSDERDGVYVVKMGREEAARGTQGLELLPAVGHEA